MDVTKFVFRIIFKSLFFVALGFVTFWLYTHPEHEYHGFFMATGAWAFLTAMDIGDDLQPESRAPWNRGS